MTGFYMKRSTGLIWVKFPLTKQMTGFYIKRNTGLKWIKFPPVVFSTALNLSIQ